MTRLSNQHEESLEITTAIKEFICSDLLQTDNIKLSDDTPLIDGGYITSLQAVELVLFLEERFQIEIPPEEVTEDEFRDLKALTALVQGKLGVAS